METEAIWECYCKNSGLEHRKSSRVGAASPVRGGIPPHPPPGKGRRRCALRVVETRLPGSDPCPGASGLPRGSGGAGWTPGGDKRPARGFCYPSCVRAPPAGSPRRSVRQGLRRRSERASGPSGEPAGRVGGGSAEVEDAAAAAAARPGAVAADPAAAEQRCAAGSAATPLCLSPAVPIPPPPGPLSGVEKPTTKPLRATPLKKKKSRIGGAWPQDPSSLGAPHPSPRSPASPPANSPPPTFPPPQAPGRPPPSFADCLPTRRLRALLDCERR
ncbi:hypothetical protein R6Z07F_005841 [Ovis aries]